MMAVNSSSCNTSLCPPPPPPSTSCGSLLSFLFSCLVSSNGTACMWAFNVFGLLVLLPLYILVICLGVRRWRGGVTASHSDLLTYNIAVAELMSVLGSLLISCGLHARPVVMQGIHFYSTHLFTQLLFHLLTCVERYLAVVHPIAYHGQRKATAVRIRDVSVGAVWLLSLAQSTLLQLEDQCFSAAFAIIGASVVLVVVLFCSLSALRVLMRLRPGSRGGSRQQIDQSKLRAFYTIAAILVVLVVKLAAIIAVILVFPLPHLGAPLKCDLWLSLVWLSLPSSLVAPLAFLLREGRLLCRRSST